jgi:hypothetical protein
MARRVYYNVNPRYSAGSPAQVDGLTARRVVHDEIEGHRRDLEGVHGEEARERAQTRGLAGIVEERTEMADCWIVADLITDARFIRLFPSNEGPAVALRRALRLAAKYNLPVEGWKK